MSPIPYRTRVKICGMTDPQNAYDIAQMGVDAIGMIFWPHSKRAVDISQAKEICHALPPYITTVGVFVNEDDSRLEQVLSQVPIDLIQYHGNEAVQQCVKIDRPFIKVVNISKDLKALPDLESFYENYASARGILLDAAAPGKWGGSGQTFDFEKIGMGLSDEMLSKTIIAGGLNAQNVGEAIRLLRPYAVEGNSGLEYSPGVKNLDKVIAFIEEVNCANKN